MRKRIRAVLQFGGNQIKDIALILKEDKFSAASVIAVFSSLVIALPVLIVCLLFIPLLVLFTAIGFTLTFLLSPFIALASIKYGKGQAYIERLKNNLKLIFIKVTDGASHGLP